MLESIVLLASLTATAADTSKLASNLETRWRAEYPLAAARWRQVTRDFVAKGRLSNRWFDGHTTDTKDLTVASSGDKQLYIRARRTTTSSKDKDGIEPSEVRCQTPDFKFTLQGVENSNKYLLVEHAPYADDENSTFTFHFDLFAKNATTYLVTDLLRRVQDPSFLLKSIGSVQRGNENLARIVYSFEDKYVTEDGHVDLDPAKDWAIRNVDVAVRVKQKPAPLSVKIDVEYKQVGDGRFFPNRMESFNRTTDPKIYEHYLLELDQITLGNAPDDIFRLSAYGIPDVPLRPSPRASVFTIRNPILWLAFGSAVICFALLWFLRSRNPREG